MSDEVEPPAKVSVPNPLDSISDDFAHIIDYVVVAKVMDGDGDVGLIMRTSEHINRWEAVGMLSVALEALKVPIASELGDWGDDADDDDDDEDDD